MESGFNAVVVYIAREAIAAGWEAHEVDKAAFSLAENQRWPMRDGRRVR